MPLKYRLVQRKDLTKDAPKDSKLYYAVNKATNTCNFDELCDTIADRSTASKGDVRLVLDGLLYVINQRLQKGENVQLEDFGNFQAILGSKGTAKEEDFTTALIKQVRIVFRPGKKLKTTAKEMKFEKIIPEVVYKEKPEENPDDKPDSI